MEEELENKFKIAAEKAVEHFKNELKKLRTGRAHSGMLDGVMVSAYGQQMPLIQLASISTPEPQLIQITPYDVDNLEAISVAIRENQTLGLSPMDDGKVIRLQIPPLTEERRRQIVKQLGEKLEECMISLRNSRHEVLKQAKADSQLSEDQRKRIQQKIDGLMAGQKKTAEEMANNKEADILKV